MYIGGAAAAILMLWWLARRSGEDGVDEIEAAPVVEGGQEEESEPEPEYGLTGGA
jgi:hypothetical protein